MAEAELGVTMARVAQKIGQLTLSVLALEQQNEALTAANAALTSAQSPPPPPEPVPFTGAVQPEP